MKNKDIIKLCLWISLIIFLLFLYYLMFVRPHIIGTYVPTSKDCQKAYDCTCVKEDCLCTYSKWFTQNKTMCSKEDLKDKQIKK